MNTHPIHLYQIVKNWTKDLNACYKNINNVILYVLM